MADPLNPIPARSGATRRTALGLLLGTPLLGACAGVQPSLTSGFGGPAAPAGPALEPQAVGKGRKSVV